MNTTYVNDLFLIKKDRTIQVAYPPLESALGNWADATTDPTSDRRDDLKHDKTKAVCDFFEWTCKPVHEITPNDVKTWQIELEQRKLAPSTVYAMISRISSFYAWLMRSGDFQGWISSNPVDLARPKSPKAYQSESTKSLDDDQIRAMVQRIKSRADTVGKRDYALCLFFLLSGLRRNEVAQLRWKDINLNGRMLMTYRAKGGDIITREIADLAVKDALLEYLNASGRLADMQPSSPVWTRLDRGGKPDEKLSSHAISKNFKRYAKDAGIDGFHLHQIRHTYARIVAEESGSLIATQDALGHKNLSTTRVYVQRIGVKKDKFSSAVADRLFQFSNQ